MYAVDSTIHLIREAEIKQPLDNLGWTFVSWEGGVSLKAEWWISPTPNKIKDENLQVLVLYDQAVATYGNNE